MKAGNVVLRGTRKMTVERINADGSVLCAWFVGSELHRASFDAGDLRKAAD